MRISFILNQKKKIVPIEHRLTRANLSARQQICGERRANTGSWVIERRIEKVILSMETDHLRSGNKNADTNALPPPHVSPKFFKYGSTHQTRSYTGGKFRSFESESRLSRAGNNVSPFCEACTWTIYTPMNDTITRAESSRGLKSTIAVSVRSNVESPRSRRD